MLLCSGLRGWRPGHKAGMTAYKSPQLVTRAMRSAMTGRCGDLHGGELGIAGAEERLRVVVLRAVSEDLGLPAQHDPAESGPVLVVAVDDDGDGGVLEDVLHALERCRRARVSASRRS